MCSQRLWRMVRDWTSGRVLPHPGAGGQLLGPWAATVSRDDTRIPVLAIEVRTYLTIAFPLGDASAFHDALAGALEAALQDLEIPLDRIATEVAAARRLSFGRLSDASLRNALNTVDYVCGNELMYHTDLRVVQRNLNEFPHPLPPDYTPQAAVRRLFRV